jgi:hypothetical protein
MRGLTRHAHRAAGASFLVPPILRSVNVKNDNIIRLTPHLIAVQKQEQKPVARPLEVELEEKLLRREAENEVTEHLAREDFGAAVHALRKLRPGDPGGPEIDGAFLPAEPEKELFYELRSALYREAKRFEAATRDLVRAVLVTDGRELTLEILGRIAALEKVELAPWMAKALAAVGARLRADRPLERRLLLEAVRGAPDELPLFVALARCEAKSSSEVELFALRQCVRLSPGWLSVRIELYRAAEAVGDRDAMRVEPRYRPGDPQGWSSRRESAQDVSVDGYRKKIRRRHGA